MSRGDDFLSLKINAFSLNGHIDPTLETRVHESHNLGRGFHGHHNYMHKCKGVYRRMQFYHMAILHVVTLGHIPLTQGLWISKFS